MTANTHASPELVRKVLARFALSVPAMALLFFVPAGTWRYWEAWVFLAVICGPLTFALVTLLRDEPDLLARRMRLGEKEPAQRRIVAASLVPFLLAFLLPGFDHRFGWSDIPPGVVLAADALVLAGYVLVLVVFRHNRYASRIVEVEAGQQVITTGPYAIVRHPMYLGVLPMYVLSPIALGSWIAALFALPMVWVLVERIREEEKLLVRDLAGYVEYQQRTRYRLIPGLW